MGRGRPQIVCRACGAAPPAAGGADAGGHGRGAGHSRPVYLNLVEQQPAAACRRRCSCRLAESYRLRSARAWPRASRAGARRRSGGGWPIRSSPTWRSIATRSPNGSPGAPGGAEGLRPRLRPGGAPWRDGAGRRGRRPRSSEVRREIERWRGHFPGPRQPWPKRWRTNCRLGAGDLYGAIAERLRVKHQLTIRVLPVDVMPDLLRRTGPARPPVAAERGARPGVAHLRRRLSSSRRSRRAAEIEALAKGAGFADRAAERLFRRHLASYFAAAVMMPYARFLRACESDGLRPRAAAAALRGRVRAGRAPADDAAARRRARSALLPHGQHRSRRAVRRSAFPGASGCAARRGGGALPAVARCTTPSTGTGSAGGAAGRARGPGPLADRSRGP